MNTTRPMSLPFEVPSISDFQRSKVLKAEELIADGLRAATEAEVYEIASDASERGGGLLSVEWGESGRGTSYSSLSESEGLIVVEEGANLHSVARCAAQHLTHPVFPEHGVEWVQNFLETIDIHIGPKTTDLYRLAYDDLEVHTTPDVRIKRVRKSALGAVNKERGVLARIIADDGPEAIICQLLELADDQLIVLNAKGEQALDLSRLRYLAYRLTEPRAARD